MNINHQYQAKLIHWEKKARIRNRMIVSDRSANHIKVNDISCINFCSNDYLGLANHPKIQEAFFKGAEKYGFGSGSSSLISGYFDIQHEFEYRFAQWLKVDKAILFNSGYLANLGVLTSLADRFSTVVSDKLCHASLLDGIQLSRAKHYRFQHQSIAHLNVLLDSKKANFVISESVFSMEGDISPVGKIVDLANKYQTSVIVDDAHGIGLLGEKGRGIVEYADVNQDQLACLITPLGKAFNGVGAMVCGKSDIIETILQFSKTYRYTTAMPPACCFALLAALDVVIEENWRREKLNGLIHFFIQEAKKRQLNLVSTDLTPIKSVVMGDNCKVLQLQKEILNKGFLVSCIRPPTVAEGSARIRISLNALHTEEEIVFLLDLLGGDDTSSWFREKILCM